METTRCPRCNTMNRVAYQYCKTCVAKLESIPAEKLTVRQETHLMNYYDIKNNTQFVD